MTAKLLDPPAPATAAPQTNGHSHPEETLKAILFPPRIKHSTFSFGVEDPIAFLYKATKISAGDKISFRSKEEYTIDFKYVGFNNNERIFVIGTSFPTMKGSPQLFCNDETLTFLLARLQNCLHYAIFEEGELAQAAKATFEGIFNELGNYETVGEFLRNDWQGSFRQDSRKSLATTA